MRALLATINVSRDQHSLINLSRPTSWPFLPEAGTFHTACTCYAAVLEKDICRLNVQHPTYLDLGLCTQHCLKFCWFRDFFQESIDWMFDGQCCRRKSTQLQNRAVVGQTACDVELRGLVLSGNVTNTSALSLPSSSPSRSASNQWCHLIVCATVLAIEARTLAEDRMDLLKLAIVSQKCGACRTDEASFIFWLQTGHKR